MLRRAALLLVGATVLLPTAVAAQWSASATGPTGVDAATMSNATGFTAACPGKLVVRLTWTASAQEFVGWYEIVRTGPDGSVTLPRVAHPGATVDDSPPAGTVKLPKTYSYTIRAGSSSHAWTTATLASQKTVSLTNSSCTAS